MQTVHISSYLTHSPSLSLSVSLSPVLALSYLIFNTLATPLSPVYSTPYTLSKVWVLSALSVLWAECLSTVYTQYALSSVGVLYTLSILWVRYTLSILWVLYTRIYTLSNSLYNWSELPLNLEKPTELWENSFFVWTPRAGKEGWNISMWLYIERVLLHTKKVTPSFRSYHSYPSYNF